METKDLLKNSTLKKDFFKYMIPSVLSMWVSALYIMVDGMFVSKGVGTTALASVNITTPFVNMIFGLSVLFSIGSSTVISSSLGKSDNKKANEQFSLSIGFLTIISIVLSIISYIFVEDICKTLGASGEILNISKEYLKIIILFAPFYIVSYALEVLIKVDGYPQLSIIGVIISALTNIILDYVFVFIFNWGVEGAGLATGLARLFSFIFFFIHFMSKKSRLKFTKFKFDFNFIKSISKIGVSDCVTEMSLGIVILLFNQIILRIIGEPGLVTYSVISYVNTLVLSTMLGISQGLQPLSSYYNGKNDEGSVKRLVSIALKTTALISLIIFIGCMLFGDIIVSMFINKSNLDIFNYTVKYFKTYSVSFILIGFNVLISGALASIHQTKDAGLISILRGIVVITISIIACTHFFGHTGIWISAIVSELVVLCVSISKIKKVLLKHN